MGKKKGNLRAALASHTSKQEKRTKEAAARLAHERKVASMGQGKAERSKIKKQKREAEAGAGAGAGAGADAQTSTGLDGAGRFSALQKGKEKQRDEEDGDGPAGQDLDTAKNGNGAVRFVQGIEGVSARKGKKKLVNPLQRDDTILLVGEGNFSFALSLLGPPHSHPPSQILATAYDTESECYRKYPDAQANVERIRAIAGRKEVVVFGVDAGNLAASKAVTGGKQAVKEFAMDSGEAGLRRWSKVWFGFPHVGAGIKDETRNVLANQLLLLRFLVSIAPLLTEGEPPAYVSANDPTQGSKKRKARDGDDDDGLDGDGDVAEEEEEDGMFELPSDDDRGAEDETDFHPPPTPVAQLPLRPPARRGSVLITLRNTSPYTLWNIPLLAKRLPTVLPSILSSAPSLPKGQRAPSLPDAQRTRYALWRSFEFRPEMWRGYSHRRTVGWIEGVSTSNNEDILRGDAEDEALGGNAKGGKMNRIRGAKAAAGECRTWEFALDVNAIEGRANRQRPKAKGGR